MKTLPIFLTSAALVLLPSTGSAQRYHDLGPARYWNGGHGGYHHQGAGPRTSFSFGLGLYPGYSACPPPIYGEVYDAYGPSLQVEVQRELSRLGYYRGSIDGVIGPRSRAAIRAYQADHGMVITGRIDATLLRSLRLT